MYDVGRLLLTKYCINILQISDIMVLFRLRFKSESENETVFSMFCSCDINVVITILIYTHCLRTN